MKTVTLDTVVRQTLLKLGLPMHYYFRFLHYGIRCIEELNYDIPLGKTGAINVNSTQATASNIRVVSFDVTNYKRVILPQDCVDVVEVSCVVGQQLFPLVKDETLTVIQSYDGSGNKIETPSATPANYDIGWAYTSESNAGGYNQFGEYLGRAFAIQPKNTQTYNIDTHASEVVLNNKVSAETVVVTYITSGVTVSSENVVHPYMVDSVEKYIIYQKYENSRMNKDMIAVTRQNYFTARRNLRARMLGFTRADLLATLRSGYYFGVKN